MSKLGLLVLPYTQQPLPNVLKLRRVHPRRQLLPPMRRRVSGDQCVCLPHYLCIIYHQLTPSHCLYIAAADAKKAEIQAKKDADAKKAAEAAAARKEEAGMFLSCRRNNTFTCYIEVLVTLTHYVC